MNCTDRIFVLKKLVEKWREKQMKEKLYIAFMDLEKVYGKVCREEAWKV